MARKCMRKGGVDHRLVSLPSLGMGLFKGSVNAKDVGMGALLGLAGSMGVKYVVNNYLAGRIPESLYRFMPALSGGVVAAGLYQWGKRKNPARAKAHALGAVVAGVAINLWDEIRVNFPSLSDLVSVQMGRYGGVLVQDSRLAGVLVSDSASNLNELNAINMLSGDDDE